VPRTDSASELAALKQQHDDWLGQAHQQRSGGDCHE